MMKKFLLMQLRELYANRGIEVGESEEDLLMNLNKLAYVPAYYDETGNPKKILPQKAILLAFRVMFPDGSYEITHEMKRLGEEIYTTTACKIYRTIEEKAQGLVFQQYEKDFLLCNRFLNREDMSWGARFEALKPYASANVLSTAIAKLGFGLSLEGEIAEEMPMPAYDETPFNPVEEVLNTPVKANNIDFLQELETENTDTSKTESDEEIPEVTDAPTVAQAETVVETEEAPVEEILIMDEFKTEPTKKRGRPKKDDSVSSTATAVPEVIDDGIQATLFDEPAQDKVDNAVSSEMTLEEAYETKCPFGTYAGKTYGELIKSQPKFMKFIATVYRSNFKAKGFLREEKALELLCEMDDNMKEILS